MADTFIQNITEAKTILEIIREAIESRAVCKISFPDTENSWISSFLEILEPGGSPKILMDHVKGFEKVLARNPQGELSLEFRDKKDIPCLFSAGVIEAGSRGILLAFPPRLQRVQRREYFRMDVPSGTEITFVEPTGRKRNGVLVDIGGGGASFLITGEVVVGVDGLLQGIHIKIPAENKTYDLDIAKGTVRRVQKREHDRIMIGIEFTEISERVRKDIIAYIFERQRSVIRRIGR